MIIFSFVPTITHCSQKKPLFENFNNDFQNFPCLTKRGLLDSHDISAQKDVTDPIRCKKLLRKDFFEAQTAEEALAIFKYSPDLQKRASNLTAIQFAIFANATEIAVLLYRHGGPIEDMDKKRLLTQCNMLDIKLEAL